MSKYDKTLRVVFPVVLLTSIVLIWIDLGVKFGLMWSIICLLQYFSVDNSRRIRKLEDSIRDK